MFNLLSMSEKKPTVASSRFRVGRPVTNWQDAIVGFVCLCAAKHVIIIRSSEADSNAKWLILRSVQIAVLSGLQQHFLSARVTAAFAAWCFAS